MPKLAGGTRPLPVSQLKSRFARHARTYLNEARDTYVPVPKAPKTPKPRAAKKPKVKKSSPLAPWQNHVKLYRAQHPDISLKEALIEAKKTYQRNESNPYDEAY